MTPRTRRRTIVALSAILAVILALQLKPSQYDPELALEAARRCEVPPPRVFRHDGCSLFPDGSWGHCCLRHDMAYWCGGSFLDHIQADYDLAECVGGELGVLMLLGVRAGGWSWVPAPTFRWGYGWPYPRGGP